MLKILAFLRSFFLAFFVAIHTGYCSIIVISLLVLRAPRKIVDFAVGPLWCYPMIKLSGVVPEIQGQENVPKNKGFLFLFTHCSHMDIPFLFVCSPKSFRYGAKASLFKIPLFGKAMELAGTLPITREDRSKVMEVYKSAEKRVANGEAFALAPEGGRREGDEIKKFKSGPFIFAINAKMPVVPVVICGMDRVLPKGSILINKKRWTKKVGVRFLPPVDMAKVPIEEMKRVKEQIREDVVREFEEMKKIYL